MEINLDIILKAVFRNATYHFIQWEEPVLLPETLGVHQARKPEGACVGVRVHLCIVREGQAWGLLLSRVTLISGFRLLSFSSG